MTSKNFRNGTVSKYEESANTLVSGQSLVGAWMEPIDKYRKCSGQSYCVSRAEILMPKDCIENLIKP